MVNRSLGMDFLPTSTPLRRLDMRGRVLLALYEHAAQFGRTDEMTGWHEDLRQAIFMYSPRFVQSPELILLSIIRWDEAKPFGEKQSEHEPGLALPPGTIGLARIPAGTRHLFRLSLRTLLRQKYINAFVSAVRAVRSLGGKIAPLPLLWDLRNRVKLSEIVGISLTMSGLQASSELGKKYRVVHPWQMHRIAALDEVFAEFFTGRMKRPKKSTVVIS
jgi:hypothetical protein